MTVSLASHAMVAREATRTLERALASTRLHWRDSTRLAFDERYADGAVAAGRTAVTELSDLAEKLSAALAALSQ